MERECLKSNRKVYTRKKPDGSMDSGESDSHSDLGHVRFEDDFEIIDSCK